MKKPLLALIALSAIAAVPAMAQQAQPDYTLSGNLTIATDYRFRGFTQTAY